MNRIQIILLLNLTLVQLKSTKANRCGRWPYRPCTDCRDPSKGKPYYFGTTNLFCIKKKTRRKRNYPSRYTLSLKHRWILYDGVYFERLRKSDTATYGHSIDMDRCKTKRERRPAGYTNLSVDCLKQCTNRYRQVYGRYRLLSNNCHHFANRMSAILCSSKCPSWCL